VPGLLLVGLLGSPAQACSYTCGPALELWPPDGAVGVPRDAAILVRTDLDEDTWTWPDALELRRWSGDSVGEPVEMEWRSIDPTTWFGYPAEPLQAWTPHLLVDTTERRGPPRDPVVARFETAGHLTEPPGGVRMVPPTYVEDGHPGCGTSNYLDFQASGDEVSVWEAEVVDYGAHREIGMFATDGRFRVGQGPCTYDLEGLSRQTPLAYRVRAWDRSGTPTPWTRLQRWEPEREDPWEQDVGCTSTTDQGFSTFMVPLVPWAGLLFGRRRRRRRASGRSAR